MIVTEAQYWSQKEAPGEEEGSQEVAMHVVGVYVQIDTVESQLEVGVAQGLIVLAQEEVSEKDEYKTENQEEDACSQGHVIFALIQACEG